VPVASDQRVAGDGGVADGEGRTLFRGEGRAPGPVAAAAARQVSLCRIAVPVAVLPVVTSLTVNQAWPDQLAPSVVDWRGKVVEHG